MPGVAKASIVEGYTYQGGIMRFILAGIILFAGQIGFADNQTIILNPGSSITVYPGAPTTIQCSGNSITPKFHCVCQENSNKARWGVWHETLGLISEHIYRSVVDCNQAINTNYTTQCWY